MLKQKGTVVVFRGTGTNLKTGKHIPFIIRESLSEDGLEAFRKNVSMQSIRFERAPEAADRPFNSDALLISFSETYNPKTALESLFSFRFEPAQDHDMDFLFVLAEKKTAFIKRSRAFLDCILGKEGGGRVRSVDDPPLSDLLGRWLRMQGYASLPEARRGYADGLHERLYWEGSYVDDVPAWVRGRMREDIFSICSAVSPSSLCALWALQQACIATQEEREFLVKMVDTWPFCPSKLREKFGPAADTLYCKMREVYPKKLSHNGGARKKRRADAYPRLYADFGGFMRRHHVESALHDLDHELFSWVDNLRGWISWFDKPAGI